LLRIIIALKPKGEKMQGKKLGKNMKKGAKSYEFKIKIHY
jgi:hypothetical protein